MSAYCGDIHRELPFNIARTMGTNVTDTFCQKRSNVEKLLLEGNSSTRIFGY